MGLQVRDPESAGEGEGLPEPEREGETVGGVREGEGEPVSVGVSVHDVVREWLGLPVWLRLGDGLPVRLPVGLVLGVGVPDRVGEAVAVVRESEPVHERDAELVVVWRGVVVADPEALADGLWVWVKVGVAESVRQDDAVRVREDAEPESPVALPVPVSERDGRVGVRVREGLGVREGGVSVRLPELVRVHVETEAVAVPEAVRDLGDGVKVGEKEGEGVWDREPGDGVPDWLEVTVKVTEVQEGEAVAEALTGVRVGVRVGLREGVKLKVKDTLRDGDGLRDAVADWDGGDPVRLGEREGVRVPVAEAEVGVPAVRVRVQLPLGLPVRERVAVAVMAGVAEGVRVGGEAVGVGERDADSEKVKDWAPVALPDAVAEVEREGVWVGGLGVKEGLGVSVVWVWELVPVSVGVKVEGVRVSDVDTERVPEAVPEADSVGHRDLDAVRDAVGDPVALRVVE